METTEAYLDVQEPFSLDESVVEYNFHDYTPIVGTNLNNVNSEIRIVVENQDLFTHPHESYLYVKGALVKSSDDSAYAATDKIALVNNAVAYLFSNVRFQIGDKTVDEINYPGFASTMKGIVSYGPEHQAILANRGWILDSAGASSADDTTNLVFKHKRDVLFGAHSPKGSFAFSVPLSHLLGFFEDYTKIIYGVKMTLTLMRTADSNAIFRHTGTAAGKIVLDRVTWRLPHVVPSDSQKQRLYGLVDAGVSVPLAFRHWYCDQLVLATSTSNVWRLITTSAIEKPRYVVIGFQTARDADQKKNPAVFDNCGVTDVHVTLNSERYPFLDLNADFGSGNVSNLYHDLVNFRKQYYGAGRGMGPAFEVSTYIKNFPLILIDCSKQSERLKSAVIDIQIKMKFGAQVAGNTQCYALVISDRLMTLKLDRSKVEVIV